MSVRLRVLGSASSGWTPDVPTWVKSCDVDGMDGVGLAELTTNMTEAITFKDAGEAMRFWRRRSRVRPLRDDGMPNRPLTVYTVEIGPE